MGVARRWVFPIIRIVIFLVIAVALAKIAFLSGSITTADTTKPSASLTEPLATVAVGTITNNLSLPATVTADASAPVKATLQGEIKRVLVSSGQAVTETTPIATIHSETDNPDGTTTVKYATVTAGSAGTLASLSIITGQLVSVGDVIGQVSPPTFSVVGSITAAQRYRLLSMPTQGEVSITDGPAPFTCTGLGVVAGSGKPGTSVRCAVPSTVAVFGGLAATLSIAGGVAKNVLVLPVTAVQGSAQNGVVYTRGSRGPAAHPVTLGLNDGTNVEITGGVTRGERVLKFVPGKLVKG